MARVINSLLKKELINLLEEIYIKYQLECDDPTEYEIMTNHLIHIQNTQTKYDKEDIEIIINNSVL